MTIIAWDGKILAADSRMTCGGDITTDKTNKIHPLKSSVSYLGDELLVMGYSGVCADVFKLLEHLQSSEFYKKDIDHGINALIIGRKHLYELEKGRSHMIQFPKNTKLAVGSGKPFAVSALSLGMNSIEAVKHAIKHNIYCGGLVRTWQQEK